MTARARLGELTRACPEGFEVHLVSVRELSELEPGDVVLNHRPDNGERGRLRVRASVTVGRYVPRSDS